MNNKQACIVLLTPGFAADENDTTCLPHIQQLVLSFKKLYSEQSIIVLSFQYPFVQKLYSWNGIQVIALGGENKTKFRRLLTWIKAYRYLKKIKREKSLSGIFSVFHTECALVGTRFARRNKVRHISWLQGQDAKADSPYVRRINAKENEIAALSVFLQNEFHKNFKLKPQYVIDNGISESAFPQLNHGERRIDVLGVGSLTGLKNYSLFIELIAQLKKRFPTIKAAIAGDGIERVKLQELINGNNLQENVELLGVKKHQEIFDLMNQSKIVLHTSHYEGSCSVIFEALYSGCKVVSTCNPSQLNFPEFYTSTDENRLYDKLLYFLSQENPERKRVLYNTMDRSAQTIMSLFQ